MHLDTMVPLDGRRKEASATFMRVAQRLPSLFDLDDQMYAILTLIEDAESSGEEPTDGLEAARAEVETLLATKTENYVSVIRTLESLHAARKAEADRLKARAASAERTADWLKQRLLVHLQTTGQQRIETPRFTIAIRQNPPRVDVLEEMLIPAEFIKKVLVSSVDKRAILEHHKSTGEIVPGVEIVRGERVALS